MSVAPLHPSKVCKSRVFEDHVSQMWEEAKNKESVSFHRAIRWSKALLVLQVFLLFPVSGVMSRTPSGLRINKYSPLYILNLVFLILSSIDLFLVLRLALILGLGIKSTSAFAFAIVTLCAGFALRQLAFKWPRLMKSWRRHEEAMLRYPYREPKYHLGLMLTSCAGLMLFLVIVGHVFALSKSVSENKANLAICQLNNTEFFQHMYNRERPQIFSLIPFSVWMIPFLELSRFMLSLYWTFIDIFIVHDNKYCGSEHVWYEIRTHYGQLTDLVDEVDANLSTIILISCANNMYFICYNIFKSFTPMPDVASVIQFWYDLLLTVLKTAAVLFSASTINETASRLANSIRQVPSHCWNIETERLVEQVESQPVALTGKNLFKLTRTLILAFAGTIVTLEIVLLDHRDKYEGTNLYKCDLSF